MQSLFTDAGGLVGPPSKRALRHYPGGGSLARNPRSSRYEHTVPAGSTGAAAPLAAFAFAAAPGSIFSSPAPQNYIIINTCIIAVYSPIITNYSTVRLHA